MSFTNSWELIKAILTNQIKNNSVIKIFTKSGYDYMGECVLLIDSDYENIEDYDYELKDEYNCEISPDFLLSNEYYYEIETK